MDSYLCVDSFCCAARVVAAAAGLETYTAAKLAAEASRQLAPRAARREHRSGRFFRRCGEPARHAAEWFGAAAVHDSARTASIADSTGAGRFIRRCNKSTWHVAEWFGAAAVHDSARTATVADSTGTGRFVGRCNRPARHVAQRPSPAAVHDQAKPATVANSTGAGWFIGRCNKPAWLSDSWRRST